MGQTLDFSRCKLQPFQHQKEDTEALIAHPWFFIASEMRTGKSAIVVLASQFLYEANQIDRVIIVTPAPVRDVWADEKLGEISKHLWDGMPATVTEYHERTRVWIHSVEGIERGGRRLQYIVTNYEFIRSKQRLIELSPFCGQRTLLVLDESSFVKDHAAQRTKACLQLRRACGRVVLLNGTPIFHSPMDLFSQGNILHSSVLDCKYVTLFKARYALQEPVLGWNGKPLVKTIVKGRFKKEIEIKHVTGWTNLDDLQEKFAPHTVRRMQADCLDLPPKLDPVTLTATLTPETWKAYKSMRDDLVVWLTTSTVAVSNTAAVKAMRLSQITSGLIGGIEDAGVSADTSLLDSLVLPGLEIGGGGVSFPSANDAERTPVSNTQYIGREKLDILLWFIEQRLEADVNLHLVTWSRFRAEATRAMEAVQEKFPQFQTAVLMGNQSTEDRRRALALLKPETSPEGPVFVAGIEGTGSFGLDMTAAHTCVTLSSGYSPGLSKQTLDRLYGPNQKHPIAYFDVIAVGPKGQRTIDHDIIVARRTGEDVATRTTAAWIKVLTEE